MARVLVTGASGFVGGHLRAELGDEFVPFDGNVLDADALRSAVRDADAVVHLAAESSVASSWEDPLRAWRVNVDGTVNVLDAVRAEQPEARVVVASTCEVYGRAERIPTPEDEPVRPLSPYAKTKAAAELACSVSSLDVVVVRPSNHEGPGRDERFAVGSWARQIARLEGEGGGALLVGDLTAERDILDVRDVARAYRLVSDPAIPAGTYNVASGRLVAMQHVVELLTSMARVRIELERDETRVRPAEVPCLAGDPARLESTTGWRPEISLERTLGDTLAAARELNPAR